MFKHTYFLSAIPTQFYGMLGMTTEIFQYTASQFSKPGEESGIVFM